MPEKVLVVDEKDIQRLKYENEKLKKKVDFYEEDASYKSFFAMNRMLNQQVEELNNFNLQSEITSSPKESKFYDRMSDLWTNLPKMVEGLNKLKSELKISGPEELNKRLSFIDTLADKRD